MMRYILSVLVLAIASGPVAVRVASDSIARPSLARFLSDADVVAYVRITSGAMLPGGGALYTAEVLQGFKGAKTGDRLEIGYYTTYGIGGEYLAFLATTDATYEGQVSSGDRSACPIGSNKLSSHRIMLAGMGMMKSDYIVEFGDYGVSFESGALLPKELESVARKGWVPKVTLATYLDGLANVRAYGVPPSLHGVSSLRGELRCVRPPDAGT